MEAMPPPAAACSFAASSAKAVIPAIENAAVPATAGINALKKFFIIISNLPDTA